MRVVTVEQAVGLIQEGDTVLIGGSGGGHAVPESLIVGLRRRFESSGQPRDLTLLHPVGLGDQDKQGVGHLAHPTLLKRIVTAALVNTLTIQEMARKDIVEASLCKAEFRGVDSAVVL